MLVLIQYYRTTILTRAAELGHGYTQRPTDDDRASDKAPLHPASFHRHSIADQINCRRRLCHPACTVAHTALYLISCTITVSPSHLIQLSLVYQCQHVCITLYPTFLSRYCSKKFVTHTTPRTTTLLPTEPPSFPPSSIILPYSKRLHAQRPIRI